jgi:GT2 family glycosyltransferase
MMQSKTLSIVIPVRNQPDTLDALLCSLDNQVRPEGWGVEVICVDNSSTDNTADVIRSHAVVYLLESTLGPSVARNAGARAAQGELLWFIDADAAPLGTDFLQKIIATADELGDFGGFGGPILLPAAQKNNPIAFADHMACWSAWNQWRPTEHSGFQPTSIVVRRSVFEEVGGYDTAIRVLEDWDLQLRLESSRQIEEGPDAPLRPVWHVQSLAVSHSARSSLSRTLKHSWYWGLPSREGWLERSGVSVANLERPVLRWLALPGLLAMRARHPLSTAWRVSKIRTLLSLPFLFLTLLVWAIAVIVGQGQPDDSHLAPV